MPLNMLGPSHQGADNGAQGNRKSWAHRQSTAVFRGINLTRHATKSEQRSWGLLWDRGHNEPGLTMLEGGRAKGPRVHVTKGQEAEEKGKWQ